MIMKKYKISDYWNMGTSIGLCAAVGIVLGALLQNLTLWLCIGASVGTLLGEFPHCIGRKSHENSHRHIDYSDRRTNPKSRL